MPKAILAANTDWYLYNFRLALARFLRDQGFEVLLISPPGRFAPQLKECGFRWIAWDLGRQTLSPFKELSSLLQIYRIYRAERPDVVHHFTVKPVLYGSLAARLLGVGAIINSITGLGYVFLSREARAGLLRRVVMAVYRFALGRKNTAVIFENDTDRQFFISQGLAPRSRAWLIEGVGTDTDHFTPLPEPSGDPVVVLPARMLWDKGVGDLVEAARILHKQVKVRVALVGEPDPGNPATIDEATLRGWDSEGVIEWWGWRQDMRSVYAASHVVTLPSLGEGVPTVLLEAAACSRPIVATDSPGCREVVRHGTNGLLVPPRDPEALASALYRLIIDPDLRGRMGAEGRKYILQKFTNRKVNTETFMVYHQVLGMPPTGQPENKP